LRIKKVRIEFKFKELDNSKELPNSFFVDFNKSEVKILNERVLIRKTFAIALQTIKSAYHSRGIGIPPTVFNFCCKSIRNILLNWTNCTR